MLQAEISDLKVAGELSAAAMTGLEDTLAAIEELSGAAVGHQSMTSSLMRLSLPAAAAAMTPPRKHLT
jgi:hypothetical protein